MELQPGEVEWLSKHMGHSSDMHKMAYRQHNAAVEISKVGKVLTALDTGQASTYHGKTIRDLFTETKTVKKSDPRKRMASESDDSSHKLQSKKSKYHCIQMISDSKNSRNANDVEEHEGGLQSLMIKYCSK